MNARAPAIMMSGLLFFLWTTWALAGGFYTLPRGARGVAQGGALVVGATGVDALWYNPAGLLQSGRQLHLDFTLPVQSVSFTRVNAGGTGIKDPFVHPLANDFVEPTVRADSATLPIPGMGYVDNFGQRDWAFGIGTVAPVASLLKWPSTVADPQNPGQQIAAPQRYSILSMEGSFFGKLILGAAWHANEYLRIGGGLGLVLSRFSIHSATSLHEASFGLGGSEAQSVDADVRVRTPFLIDPMANAGFILDLGWMRFGGALETPFTIEGDARIKMDITRAQRLNPGLLGDVIVQGDRAEMLVKFPWVARGGVEVRPISTLRVEMTLTWEQWSAQKEIRTTPFGVGISNLPLIGWGGSDYMVSEMAVPRRMKDTYAVGLGAEYQVSMPIMLRVGVMHESGAFEDRDFTVMTPDTDKVLLGGGFGWNFRQSNWTLDLSGGGLYHPQFTVTDSRIYRPQAIRPSLNAPLSATYQSGDPVPLGNGRYRIKTWFAALGLRWRL